MQTHVKVLGWLHLIFGILGVCIAVLAGGFTAVAGLLSGDMEAVMGLGLIGALVAIGITLLCIPALLAGWGLLRYREWARILMLVLSFLNLLNIPFGTVLGIYGLWVLLNEETVALFRRGGPGLEHGY